MSLEILTIPCLSDNYAYLLHNAASGETAAVDVPEAAPLLEVLADRGWTLTTILITHHHADHVQGLADLLAQHPAQVIGAEADAHRLPPLDVTAMDGDMLNICGAPVQVLEVPGHTIGHIAFHFPQSGAVFTADSLMALGCGRLFEGTPAQMHGSLSRLAALPAETIVYSGHEYTQANAKFALTIDPDNPDLISRAEAVSKARECGAPTVPSTLAEELATNPFLRAGETAIQQKLGMAGADPVAVFAEIRARKDRF